MPWRLAKERGNIAARKLAAIKYSFEHCACFRRQSINAGFFLDPQQDSCPQPVRLHKGFHEGDLVDTSLQEEACECDKSLLAQIAASVEVVASREIALGEMFFVAVVAARKPSCDRPNCTGVERFQQRGVRHQTGHAAISIKERMNPQKTVMRSCRRQDCVCLANAAERRFKMR